MVGWCDGGAADGDGKGLVSGKKPVCCDGWLCNGCRMDIFCGLIFGIDLLGTTYHVTIEI